MSNRITEGTNLMVDTISADVILGRVAPYKIIFVSTKAADKVTFADNEDNALFELRLNADNQMVDMDFPKGKVFTKLKIDFSGCTLTGTYYVYILQ